MEIALCVFAEGRTDVDFFEKIIGYVGNNFDLEIKVITQHPQYDETSGKWMRGSDGLIDFYRESGGWKGNDKTIKSEDKLKFDRDIFAKSGFLTFPDPRHAQKNQFDMLRALYGNPMFIFSIDGDTAEKISAKIISDKDQHPMGEFTEGNDRFLYCKEAVMRWTNSAEDDATTIWAIPVYCLESWFLALYAPLENQDSIEHINTQNVYDQLIKREHPTYIDKDGKVTVDKIKLVKDHSHKIIQQIDKIKEHCPSFAQFIDDARQKLESRCVHPHNE